MNKVLLGPRVVRIRRKVYSLPTLPIVISNNAYSVGFGSTVGLSLIVQIPASSTLTL